MTSKHIRPKALLVLV